MNLTLRRPAPDLDFGADAFVDLFPADITAERRLATLTKRSWGAVIAIALAVTLVIITAAVLLFVEHTGLAAANADTTRLNQAMTSYDELIQLRAETQVLGETLTVAEAGQIDWARYGASLRQCAPPGTVLTSITLDGATAATPYPQSTIPLQGPRIAQVTVQLDSLDPAAVTVWLECVAELPGFADAAPTTIAQQQLGYTSSVVVHLNVDALLNQEPQS